MIVEAQHFLEESAELRTLLVGRDKGSVPTQFKQWTIDDIVRHLHVWNTAARLTVLDASAFGEFYRPSIPYIEQMQVRTFERTLFGHLHGDALLAEWWAGVEQVAEVFLKADPRMRVAWGGPSMSARSCISARLMETWAHSQAIYDVLGMVRVETDRVRSIAVLGVNTYEWSFSVRGLVAPPRRPSIRLTAPSGDIWVWESPDSDDKLEGSAVEFCQVVTQTRNIHDTSLTLTGRAAGQWMEIAQCFAGPPQTPPLPGTRFRARQAE